MINKNFQTFFQACWFILRGVAGPYQFFGKKLKFLKKSIKIGYFLKIIFVSIRLFSEELSFLCRHVG